VANKNNELEKFQSSMNHEKINLTAKQEQVIDQWKEKYEKVIYYLLNISNAQQYCISISISDQFYLYR